MLTGKPEKQVLRFVDSDTRFSHSSSTAKVTAINPKAWADYAILESRKTIDDC